MNYTNKNNSHFTISTNESDFKGYAIIALEEAGVSVYTIKNMDLSSLFEQYPPFHAVEKAQEYYSNHKKAKY